jgi:sugar O-acyltransferase (sialic acid O-acetyltransferase NeuD family)
LTGYIDKQNHGEILGLPYLGDDSELYKIFQNGIKVAVIGIGQVHITKKRSELTRKLEEIGFKLPYIISKNAVINEDVIIGEGTQIFDGVVINPGTRIGKGCIINTCATIEHDCNIGNFCHIATRAVLSGGVEIEDFSMIGSNAVIVQFKKITSNTLIGSGGVVIRDIPESGTYVGNPVRKVS